MMTRDDARAKWAASGLTYEALTPNNLQLLRRLINEEMTKSGFIQDSLRARQRFSVREDSIGKWAELRCRAYYFNNREAVTFNSDGFVGFAGWSDELNIQPILTAFCAWVDQVSEPALAAA